MIPYEFRFIVSASTFVFFIIISSGLTIEKAEAPAVIYPVDDDQDDEDSIPQYWDWEWVEV